MPVIKSGTDFRELTELTVDFAGAKPAVTWKQVEVTADLPEDATAAVLVQEYTGELAASMDKVQKLNYISA